MGTDYSIKMDAKVENGKVNITLTNEGESECFSRVKISVPDYVTLSTSSRKLVIKQ